MNTANLVVLVCGGKDFADYDQLKRVLDQVCSWSPTGHVTILNTGEPGAAQLSSQWAKERGEGWKEYNTAIDTTEARLMNNDRILSAGKPEQAVIFPGGNWDLVHLLMDAGVNGWIVGKNI